MSENNITERSETRVKRNPRVAGGFCSHFQKCDTVSGEIFPVCFVDLVKNFLKEYGDLQMSKSCSGMKNYLPFPKEDQ